MVEVYKKERESEQIQKMLGNGYSHNFWDSFVLNPHKLCFDAQHESEEVILLGRRQQ